MRIGPRFQPVLEEYLQFSHLNCVCRKPPTFTPFEIKHKDYSKAVRVMNYASMVKKGKKTNNIENRLSDYEGGHFNSKLGYTRDIITAVMETSEPDLENIPI